MLCSCKTEAAAKMTIWIISLYINLWVIFSVVGLGSLEDECRSCCNEEEEGGDSDTVSSLLLCLIRSC